MNTNVLTSTAPPNDRGSAPGVHSAVQLKGEMEGSRDELASVNENLNIANHELASRVEALHQLNADLRAAEEQQRLLVAELNHRVRNMLQVVIGLGNQTLRQSADLKEFETTFMGRMQALARAYGLLSRDGWNRVPLQELVRTQLSAFASEGGRYSAQGEPVELTPTAALALGMVLYELATNATKYGALSTPDGRVALLWELQDKDQESRELVMHWTESGGPPVDEPTRNGFGSELVKRQLKYELKGHAVMEFHRGGLHATLIVPATGAVVAGGPRDMESISAPPGV